VIYTAEILKQRGLWIRDCNTRDFLSIGSGSADSDTGAFVGWIFEKPAGQKGGGRSGIRASTIMAFDVLEGNKIIDKARP
jgi:hypothetical protein